ncbi:hypothetical protein LguiA_032349 [Lonicera macranthoides]
MKHELAFALESQSHLTEFSGRTRSCKSPSTNRIKEEIQGCSATENEKPLNTSIDQNRASRVHTCNALHVYRRHNNKRLKIEEGESVINEKSMSGLVIKEVKNERRFTRSALEPKVMGNLELGNGNSALVLYIKIQTFALMTQNSSACEEVKYGEGLEAEGNADKKMELKILKKIEMKNKPTTVEELLETGLLEGYPVFYKSGKKVRIRGVHGLVDQTVDLQYGRDRLCQSSYFFDRTRLKNQPRPGQFEREMCSGEQLKTPGSCVIAACARDPEREYICLENGRSLLQVVKACMSTSLETLEETIRSFIGPLPAKESAICLKCKACAINGGKLCDSCVDSVKSEASPTNTTGVRSSKMSTNTTFKKARSSRSGLFPKSPKRASVCILSQNRIEGKMSKKLSKSSPCKSEFQSQGKITKKLENGLPDGTEVAYYSGGQKLLEGYKKGSGIFCHCCNSEVSASQFEAHAGWASRRKPYGYIYTSNGVSLHELAISLLKGRTCSLKDNDDLCIICADGGNLLLCDGCPRAFHKECASLSTIPRGKWYCTYCQSMFQREKFVEHNANALAAGRVSGVVDPIEQITTRCIRIVKNSDEAQVIACVLCRGYDYSKSGFGPRTVILCDQCEKEYHVGCLKEHEMADLKELPKEKWFCCIDCRRIYSTLQNLINSGAEKLPDSLLDTIKEKAKGLEGVTEFDVRWRLLSGKLASRETRLLLSQAIAIFHECFDPIVDSTTGRDFIPTMVYGRNIRGQDFGGMYCAILTVNSSVVSAGILRVFGPDRAELPLVATSKVNQGKREGPAGKGADHLAFSSWAIVMFSAYEGPEIVPEASAVTLFGKRKWLAFLLPLSSGLERRGHILKTLCRFIDNALRGMFGNRTAFTQRRKVLHINHLPLPPKTGKAHLLPYYPNSMHDLHGYFQLLFSCIEKLLAFLKVKALVLPAAEVAESIWTNKFRFKKISPQQLMEYSTDFRQMLTFKGTSMLEKPVPSCRINQKDAAGS